MVCSGVADGGYMKRRDFITFYWVPGSDVAARG